MAGKFSIEGIFKAHDGMTGAVAKITARMERMQLRVSGVVSKYQRMNDRIGRSFGKAFSGADDFISTRITPGFGAIGIAAAAASAASVGALVSIARAANGVEDSMAKVATVITPATGTIQNALAETRAAAIAWSKQHVNSAKDFIEANYRMASAGLDSAQAIAGTRAALTLSTATMGDATTASNLLSTIFNNMGDKSRDASQEFGRLGDVIAKTQALFQLADLGQLNEGLKLATPSAKQFGVSVEQLNTVIGSLNTAGLQGSMAGTAFAATMRQMGKASKELGFNIAKTADGGVDFVGTIKNIEKKFGSFQKMTDEQKASFQQAFGDEGVRGVSLLLGQTDQLAANLEKVAGSAGAAAAAQKVIEGTRSSSLEILGNRIEAIKLALADALLPALDKLGPHISTVIGALDRWVNSNQGLLGSGFGKFLDSAITGMKTFADAFGAGFKEAWPAISGALGMLFQGFGDAPWLETVKKFATVLGKVTAAAVGVAAVFGGMLAAGFQLLGSVVSTVVNGVMGAWDGLIAGIGNVILWFDNLGARIRYNWEHLPEDAAKAAKGLIDGLVNGLTSGAQWVIQAVQNLGTSAMGALKKLLGISSPSKVFEAFGANTAKGFAIGLEPLSDTLKNALPAKLSAPKVEPMKLPSLADVAPAPKVFGDTMTNAPAWALDRQWPLNRQPGGAAGDEADAPAPRRTNPPFVVPPSALTPVQSSSTTTNSNTTERSEVTIKDETGRAKVTKQPRGMTRLKMAQYGRL